MKMQNLFQKLVQFSRYLKTGGCFREFNFLKLNSKSTPTFHVDVSDEEGKRYQFFLSFDGKSWKICSDVFIPKWVVDASDMLQKEAIAGEESVA
jgi:hypothetical protein